MQFPQVNYTDQIAPQLLAEALHNIGFVVLSDHPIDAQLISDVYTEWAEFFNSPTKTLYTFKPEIQAGYFPFQTETAKGYSQPDLKEFFHLYKSHNLPKGMSDRSWQLFQSLINLGEELLSWIESVSPDVVRDNLTMSLEGMIKNSQENLLRILHYPPLTSEYTDGAIRAAAHEDINLITLLPAATATGLQVLDNFGVWHDVPSNLGDIVINVGDMLQLATGGYYRSTTHRVINGESAHISRYSMPMFLHARPEVVLSGTKTAREYLQERLREIGLIK
ncbi:dioxygenase, isopenicillin N synthase [Synechococcus sp. PCC 7502]|uniref:isopenicillin N synthase family dioxygenase n=1 Tax=Synechococcus sp. PCC 7502 TaxID=1173263 RepID=UPI00029FCCD5|nr:2OG-Fe(II) oxygenase family protein [Synechococcus sp. PCC 7502]AFY74105.1 dioxygenase, isopenicillin N synthase [Synechococcus sp. PCC 7502]